MTQNIDATLYFSESSIDIPTGFENERGMAIRLQHSLKRGDPIDMYFGNIIYRGTVSEARNTLRSGAHYVDLFVVATGREQAKSSA